MEIMAVTVTAAVVVAIAAAIAGASPSAIIAVRTVHHHTGYPQ